MEKHSSLFLLKRPTLGNPRTSPPPLLKSFRLRLTRFHLAPLLLFSLGTRIHASAVTLTSTAWTRMEQVSVGSGMANSHLGSTQLVECDCLRLEARGCAPAAETGPGSPCICSSWRVRSAGRHRFPAPVEALNCWATAEAQPGSRRLRLIPAGLYPQVSGR